MNLWLVAGLAIGLLVVAGLVVANVSTAQEPEKISCENCGSSCSLDKNCGLASCGAISGERCNCGK